MKYWVYINSKVDGPYDENSLASVEGFTPDTLICSEEAASSGSQEWVKASSVFEFAEEPAEEQADLAADTTPQPTQTEEPAVDTQALFEQVELLTSRMSNLQTQVNSMETRLEETLAENKKLAQQVAANPTIAQEEQPLPTPEEARVNTITLTKHDIASGDKAEKSPSYPQQADPQEDELVIRSALDSMYGGKLLRKGEQEDESFHDLVTGETSADLARAAEEEAVEDMATQLRFTPVEEESAPQEEPVVEKAIVTTPSVLEAEKDALIKELTSSAKDDVLDQIIAEHQNAPEPSKQTSATAATVAATAAAAGLAAAAVASVKTKKEEPLTIAPDKNNPSQLEEVLPANQMPEDVLPPALEETPAETKTDLPTVEPEPQVTPAPEPETAPAEVQLPVADMPDAVAPQPAQEQSAPQAASLPVADMPDAAPVPTPQAEPAAVNELPSLGEEPVQAQVQEELPPAQEEEPQAKEETTLEELVPAARSSQADPQTNEPEQDPEDSLPQDLSVKPEPELQPELQAQTQEPQPELQTQEPQPKPAPSKQEEPVAQTTHEVPPQETQEAQAENAQPLKTLLEKELEKTVQGNPNDLTEIELKEGSTYLISDFVPPAQVTDDVAAVMNSREQNQDKKQDVFQDMLAASTISQSAKPLNTNGLPDDLSATQVNLENTIQAKRGASFDIKTVPMVPEPDKTKRLDLNDLDDVNTQHGLRRNGMSRSAKLLLGGLVAVFALIVLYVMLGFLHLLPASVNLFASKKEQPAATVQNTQAFLTQEEDATQPQVPSPLEKAQEKVQNFPLPNGYKLKGFIESKHATISPDLITWEVAEAVEADNYSVTVRVPPENPQNFKTVYRFNYNMQTGMLDPTISDAKNLLDQAYGVNAAQSAVASATSSGRKTTATRRTTRKR